MNQEYKKSEKMKNESIIEKNIFLTVEEVAELTGIRRGNNKKSYAQLQVEWLLRHGFIAHLNEAGRAIVARETLVRQNTFKKIEWSPNVLR